MRTNPLERWLLAELETASVRHRNALLALSNAIALAEPCNIFANGQYVAYDSDESGRFEVYVRPVGGNGKWQISAVGGQQPSLEARRPGDLLHAR
jgi:hypothetical protein